jgi:hypothetical protein
MSTPSKMKPVFQTSPAETPQRVKITSRPIKTTKVIGGEDHITALFAQEKVQNDAKPFNHPRTKVHGPLSHQQFDSKTPPPLPNGKSSHSTQSSIFAADTPPKEQTRRRDVGGSSSMGQLLSGGL